MPDQTNNLLTSGVDTSMYPRYNALTGQGGQPQQVNPLAQASQMLSVAGQAQGLQQQQFATGKAKLDLIHNEMGALTAVPGGPSYDQVMSRINQVWQSGAMSGDDIQRMLPNIPSDTGPQGNAARKAFFDAQLQITGDYQQKMTASYGQPGLINRGDIQQPVMGDVRTGNQQAVGPGLSMGLTPGERVQRFSGVANGVPFTAPVGPGFSRTGDLLPPPPQGGANAASTMAPRALAGAASSASQPAPIGSSSQPVMMSPQAAAQQGAPGGAGTSVSPNNNPAGLTAPVGQAVPQGMPGLPPGAVQSQQGPGVDATANAQALANQSRAAALQEAASRAPVTKAILDRLDMNAAAFTGGPASPLLKKAGGYINQAAGIAGIDPPITSQAAREAFDKDSALLAGEQSSTLGGTDAARALASVMTPGASNTNEGIRSIAAVLKGNQDATLAKAQAWDSYRRAFPAGQADYGHFETQFNQSFSPRAFGMVYMSQPERQKMWNNMSAAEQAQVQRSYDAAKAQGYLKPGASQ